MKQSVFIYSALAAIVLGSVVFGLDWQPATLSPMAPIQVVALPPPPPPPVKVAAPAAAQNPTASAAVSTPRVPSIPPLVPVAPITAPPPAAQAPPKPHCDVAACAAAYRSFRESDCTFNPSVGPRQLCTKGVVPKETPKETAPAPAATSDAPASIMRDEPNARTNAQTNAPPNAPAGEQPNVKCNVSACAAAYHSFTESDCTFMANGGVRKLCTK